MHQPDHNQYVQQHQYQYQQQQPQQHQPWMGMSQPMPPPAGWTPQPVPLPVPSAAAAQMQPQFPGMAGALPGSVGSIEIKSLWIGDLQPHMDEGYLLGCFAHTGEVISAKVIRNRQTGTPEGYGFVEFLTRAAAERVLQTYNGTLMPNSDQNFRMNWATLGPGEKRQDDGPEHTIFVGDLASDVTDVMLQELFQAHYPSVKGAKIVMDKLTGRSKGYGFVRFTDESEQMRAMTEMNGMYCSSRPMRIGPAANKKSVSGQQFLSASYPSAQGSQGENDPNNTTIFVGGLDPSVSDDHLRQVFGQFGELHHVKIPPGKRCGFVQFASRACAEQALLMLNGTQLGGQSIRLSWGRSPSNKQIQTEQSQWNGGYYGYPQGYEAYGYAPPAQDPSMYYGGYAGYNYQQPMTYQQPQQ
ncbi:hypothetical protein MLD38_022068 [Melastoma candidum]|uniref:Uncharacterized protein n=1 Tax=Melastoma candidum TaxID=119954 RepID=A0ACB9QJ04_9MYRT|nr:hypothetical protein MLD38_022068 [Melastoma candidum]